MTTKLLIDRELLERELLSVLDFSESNLRRVVDHLLDAGYTRAAPRQPSDDVAKDAARYQWLVKHSTYGIDYRQRPELTLSIYAPDHRDGLSAAIDAAMAGGEG